MHVCVLCACVCVRCEARERGVCVVCVRVSVCVSACVWCVCVYVCVEYVNVCRLCACVCVGG